MYQVRDDGGERFKRFELASKKVRELGDLFQNPGATVSEEELVAWIIKADMACHALDLAVKDSLISLHGGL